MNCLAQSSRNRGWLQRRHIRNYNQDRAGNQNKDPCGILKKQQRGFGMLVGIERILFSTLLIGMSMRDPGTVVEHMGVHEQNLVCDPESHHYQDRPGDETQ